MLWPLMAKNTPEVCQTACFWPISAIYYTKPLPFLHQSLLPPCPPSLHTANPPLCTRHPLARLVCPMTIYDAFRRTSKIASLALSTPSFVPVI